MEKLLRNRHLSSNRNDLCVNWGGRVGKRPGAHMSGMEKQLTNERWPTISPHNSFYTPHRCTAVVTPVRQAGAVRTLMAKFSPPVAHFCRDFVFSSRILIHLFSLVMSVCRRLAPGELEGGRGSHCNQPTLPRHALVHIGFLSM